MPEMRFSESVSARPEDGVLGFTIDNPPVNALSAHVRSGLIAALDNAAADEAVTGIVITGTGGVFIGGADIREFGKLPLAPALPDVVNRIEASPSRWRRRSMAPPWAAVRKLRWPAMAASPARLRASACPR